MVPFFDGARRHRAALADERTPSALSRAPALPYVGRLRQRSSFTARINTNRREACGRIVTSVELVLVRLASTPFDGAMTLLRKQPAFPDGPTRLRRSALH